MYIQKQAIYDDFRCIAADCPESCCKLWQILIDDDSLEKYKLMGRIDGRVKSALDINGSCFKQHDRRCAFLCPDELCYLQRTYGEEALCVTCRDFPRHTEEFENVRELSLSISCPHAAKLILTDERPMAFTDAETDEEDEEFEDFDYILYDKLLDARCALFKIAQDRSLCLAKRLELILSFGEKFQSYLDEDRLFEADELFDDPVKLLLVSARASGYSGCGQSVFGDREEEKRNFSVLFELEQLHPDWGDTLERTWKTFFEGSSDPEPFADFVKKFEIQGEQILMSFLYTYFCGAVYDAWISSKTAFAVYSVRWIFYIAYADGGDLDALLKAAWQFARESEHSDINLDTLEEWFMKDR